MGYVQTEDNRRARTTAQAKDGVLSERQWPIYKEKLLQLSNGKTDICFTPREALQFLLDKRDITWGDLKHHAHNFVEGRTTGALRSMAARRGGFAESAIDLLSRLTSTKADIWRQDIPHESLVAMEIDRRKLFSCDAVHPRPAIFDSRRKKREFDTKLKQLESGLSVTLTAGEYLCYVLIQNQIKEAAFENKLGVSHGYMNKMFHKPHSLPNDLAQALAELSNKDVAFWHKPSFALPQDDLAVFDMNITPSVLPRYKRADATLKERQQLNHFPHSLTPR